MDLPLLPLDELRAMDEGEEGERQGLVGWRRGVERLWMKGGEKEGLWGEGGRAGWDGLRWICG